MKITSFLAVCLLFSLMFLGGAEKKPDFQLKVMEKAVKSSLPVTLSIRPETEGDYVARAWRVIAYLPNVPPEFPKEAGFKVNHHAQKEWSTVQIMEWNWNIPASGVLELPTLKWPEGDYGLVLYVLFQGKDKEKKLPAVYRNHSFPVTILSK